MDWETKKLIWLALCPYLFYFGGLELTLQYLQSMSVEYFRELSLQAFRLHLHIVWADSCRQLLRRPWERKLEKYVINTWDGKLSMNRVFFPLATVQMRGGPTDMTCDIKSVSYSVSKMTFRYPTHLVSSFYVPGTKPLFLSFLSLPTYFEMLCMNMFSQYKNAIKFHVTFMKST